MIGTIALLSEIKGRGEVRGHKTRLAEKVSRDENKFKSKDRPESELRMLRVDQKEKPEEKRAPKVAVLVEFKAQLHRTSAAAKVLPDKRRQSKPQIWFPPGQSSSGSARARSEPRDEPL